MKAINNTEDSSPALEISTNKGDEK